jgi:hypothetical protein
VRSAYTAATGEDTKGLKLEGKGGRSPGEGDSAKPAKKAAAKTEKAATKATSASGKVIPLVEMDKDQLATRLDGKTIQVGRGSKMERIDVKAVKKLAKGDVTFTDGKGASRTVAVKNIVKASR